MPIKGKTDYKKALDSRIRENDGQRIEIPGIDWIPDQGRYDEGRSPKFFWGLDIMGCATKDIGNKKVQGHGLHF